MTNRIAAFDTARGFTIIMMVFAHALFVEKTDYITPDVYQSIATALQPMRMPLLFLVAGVMASSLRFKANNYLRQRIANLSWIYLIWVPVIAIVDGDFAVIDRGVAYYPLSLLEIVRATTVLWFLWCLIVCTALIPVFRRIPKIIAMGALTVWSVASYYVSIPWPTLDSLGHFAVFFYAGVLGKSTMLRILALEWDVRVFGALVILTAMIQAADGIGYPIPNIVNQSLICALALYAFASPFFEGSFGRLLAYFGRNTLPIYVIHYPLLILLLSISPDFVRVGGLIPPLLLTASAVAISLFLRQLANKTRLYWLFERPPYLSTVLRGLRSRLSPNTGQQAFR